MELALTGEEDLAGHDGGTHLCCPGWRRRPMRRRPSDSLSPSQAILVLPLSPRSRIRERTPPHFFSSFRRLFRSRAVITAASFSHTDRPRPSAQPASEAKMLRTLARFHFQSELTHSDPSLSRIRNHYATLSNGQFLHSDSKMLDIDRLSGAPPFSGSLLIPGGRIRLSD